MTKEKINTGAHRKIQFLGDGGGWGWECHEKNIGGI